MDTPVTIVLILLVIAFTCVIGAYAYPFLPPYIASHWDAQGSANGQMPKFWGIFLIPIMMAVFFLLYLVIPVLEPMKANLESFRRQYNMFWTALFAFFLYVFALVLTWNLGYRFNFTTLLIPAFAVLWYSVGSLLERSKRNWFVGIRTPWTLSSDAIWKKTHELGGKLFKISSVISLLGLLLPAGTFQVFLFVLPAVLTAIVTVLYSYLQYKK